jgi:hypothetical protein
MRRIACLGLLLAATAVVPAQAQEIVRRSAGRRFDSVPIARAR